MSINLFNTNIQSVAIHKVGNKSRGENLFIAALPYTLSDEIAPLLKEYFFKPFRDKEEQYFNFAHDVHLDYNQIQVLCKSAFSSAGGDMLGISKKIAKHLYDQSNHPHIKAGELYVCYLNNVEIDSKKVDAIGIFKSEIKSDFLQFKQNDNILLPKLQQGINLSKLDKGAIIFNYKAEEGYKILCVDQNRYDARYWLEHFLSVDAAHDEHFTTKKYMKFVQDFAKDVVLPAEDKKEEVMFMNRAVNHFAKNDTFEETAFLNDVLDNPDLVPEFKSYKADKGAKHSVDGITNFTISNTAVTDARKKIKPVINLDTNIQIKLDFINPESAEKFIEKGWDEEKHMYYYLVYFNKETK